MHKLRLALNQALHVTSYSRKVEYCILNRLPVKLHKKLHEARRSAISGLIVWSHKVDFHPFKSGFHTGGI